MVFLTRKRFDGGVPLTRTVRVSRRQVTVSGLLAGLAVLLPAIAASPSASGATVPPAEADGAGNYRAIVGLL